MASPIDIEEGEVEPSPCSVVSEIGSDRISPSSLIDENLTQIVTLNDTGDVETGKAGPETVASGVSTEDMSSCGGNATSIAGVQQRIQHQTLMFQVAPTVHFDQPQTVRSILYALFFNAVTGASFYGFRRIPFVYALPPFLYLLFVTACCNYFALADLFSTTHLRVYEDRIEVQQSPLSWCCRSTKKYSICKQQSFAVREWAGRTCTFYKLYIVARTIRSRRTGAFSKDVAILDIPKRETAQFLVDEIGAFRDAQMPQHSARERVSSGTTESLDDSKSSDA